MGMETTVIFEESDIPSWMACRAFLQLRRFPVQLRMIDGELAFPDETPPDAWRELRVGTPHGMVTLRRDRDRIAFVTWGNADAAMMQAWNALIWAVAEVGGGRVDTAHGLQSAAEFRRSADLPAVLQGAP
jgi:hypothetical protein